MESSDEEGEIVPGCATDYHFVDHNNELVSLDALPLQWSQSETVCDSENKYFLIATAEDDSLQKIHKGITAWRFDLSFVQPEVSVLSKDAKWIILQKPRKSFEDSMRTLLVTIHWLHFLKKNPEASAKDLWSYLLKIFSSFDVEPSGKDLYVHMLLIAEAIKRDKDLAKCKNLLDLMERPREDADSNEDESSKKSKFIVEMDEDLNDEDIGEFLDADEGLYDPVCALCDNGGEILCCQGKCMRSFHATISAGNGYCDSLGYQEAQVNAIPTFLCLNCKYRKHQCFVCGTLGSSDSSSGAVVFPCISATCGHFYHAECAANLLEPENTFRAKELQDMISSGESFTCPVHKCYVCDLGEDKKVHELQFAVCRRCPKAYHRKCLPSTIPFKKDSSKNVMQRAWDDLLPNRILIYCLDHEIMKELETPIRNHIKFPAIRGQQNAHSSGFNLKKLRMREFLKVNKNLPKRDEHRRCGGIANLSIREQRFGPSNNLLTKRSTATGIGKSFVDNNRPEMRRLVSKTEGKIPMRNNLSIVPKQNLVRKAIIEAKKIKGSSPALKAEMEKRVLALMKESDSLFNREEFLKRRKVPITYDNTSQNFLETTITDGKVEGSVMAIRKAVKMLDEGCSIEDAKAVCGPEILSQIYNWKTKLQIYLAPFLHGMRYTSYGRHFTKVDKLREVVNRLHHYVKNGDTIVDFCCGSNDFSIMMKEKLDQTGKHCCFKNFDLIMPKNDFCFEQRDWMSVKLEELHNGSQLIMGLNPPFGVNASLANMFITKALQFNPKLLILIVPEVTRRPDQIGYPYDLIWEDREILSGKSFYLPGSIDVNNKQLEDWNLRPPPLYLWSRRDWTVRHREIYMEHIQACQKEPLFEEINGDRDEDDSDFNISGDDICVVSENASYDEDDSKDLDSNTRDLEERDGAENPMCIDMEISPPHSPTCVRALHDVFGSSSTVHSP